MIQQKERERKKFKFYNIVIKRRKMKCGSSQIVSGIKRERKENV